MAELFETQERTEEATPRHREEARTRGNFARSADLSTAVVLLATAGVLIGVGPALLRGLEGGIISAVGSLARPPGDLQSATLVLRDTLCTALRWTAPFLFAGGAAAAALHFTQAGGFFLAKDALVFKPERLDPTQNLARLLGVRSFAKVAAAFLKLLVIVAVLALSLRGRLDEVALYSALPFQQAAPRLGMLLLDLFLRTCAVLLVLGFGDWLFQRWQHARDLRMSKQQVHDEQKQEEGDPQAKRTMRSRMRKLTEKPLWQAVRESAVIIANPTHIAIALEYVEGRSSAPKVVAKGADRVAQEIKRLARELEVPVIEQPPLARALFRDVRVGELIPDALYRAVAGVLAIVWRLRDEKRRAAQRPAATAAGGRN